MSQQGPILIVSDDGLPSFTAAIDQSRLFPLIESDWRSASQALGEVQPVAILAGPDSASGMGLSALARQAAGRKPYLPIIAIDPDASLPATVLPFTASGKPDRLLARLRAALRVRALHTTVLRRLHDQQGSTARLPDTDPVEDATVLLMGRGGSFPGLSVALGQRLGVLGAFSMEAAGKHLNSRQIDGIVLAAGFSPKVVDAFLMVLAEDARFRNMPVVMTPALAGAEVDLPNLEVLPDDTGILAACALPLIRQRAFEARLGRTVRAIEAGGLLDPQTGLLTQDAFARDFEKTIRDTLAAGGGLSVARFGFDLDNPRAQFDGARIISHLMRKMDFGTARPDGSVVVVFADAGQRAAQGIARRLSSVIRQTSHGRGGRNEPVITIATLMPSDTAASLLGRLEPDRRRAAS